MSITIELFFNHCPYCGRQGIRGERIHEQNITHNLVPMWKKAGVYAALYESDGQFVTEDYVQTITKGVVDMTAHFSEYEKLDSPNGWGLATNALPWLARWLEVCRRHLGATIRVSK